MKHTIQIVIILLMLLVTGETYAMSDLYLFSAVKGVVVKNGVAVKGALVEQEYRWAWKDEVGVASATTDAGGQFSFPAVVRRSLLGSFLPHEPWITQTILIKHEGVTYKAWMFDKGDYKDKGELQGKPIDLYCDLDAPLGHKGTVYGICQLR